MNVARLALPSRDVIEFGFWTRTRYASGLILIRITVRRGYLWLRHL